MKKVLSMIIAALFLASPSLVTVADAQSAYSKRLEKQRKKEYKEKIKKLTKEGWLIFGSSHTMEVALLEHYDRLCVEGVYELSGYATSSQKNIGSAKLLQDAAEKYASLQGQEMRGRTVTEHGSEMTEDDIIELDNFLQGFDAKVQTEIKGELRPSYMIYRKATTANGKPCYEFEGYFIVNQEAAHKARVKAMEAMMKEQAAMHKLSEKTAAWIKEAFEAEDGTAAEE